MATTECCLRPATWPIWPACWKPSLADKLMPAGCVQLPCNFSANNFPIGAWPPAWRTYITKCWRDANQETLVLPKLPVRFLPPIDLRGARTYENRDDRAERHPGP